MRLHKLITGLVFCLCLGTQSAIAATLIDDGIETIDTGTNLAWLDLTETNGMSVDQSLSAFSSYRVATQAEVMGLFATAGLPTFNTTNATLNSAASILISLLGATFNNGSTIGFQGWSLGTDGLLYNDPFVLLRDVGTTLETTTVYTGSFSPGWRESDFAVLGVGTYLVREVAPIPLPGAVGLLMLGLGTLVVVRRRQT
jgi:hypothetical protein